jgi:hypothetical protein
MPALFERTQVGKRESLADMIAVADAAATPFTSMAAKRAKVNNMLHTWQVKKLKKSGHKGIVDGKDAENFTSNGRTVLEMYAQKTWDLPAVSDLAEESDVAGVSRKEMSEQVADGILAVKTGIEQRGLSNEECQADDGNTKGYETRGMGKWILATAQAVKPVDAAFLTPSASIHAAALSGLTESAFKALCASMYKQRKKPTKMDGFVGIDLKTVISGYGSYQDDVSNKTAVRTFNQDAKSKALIDVIDRLVLDTGEIDLHLSANIYTDAATGEDSAYTHKSGLFLDMEYIGLAYQRMPRVVKLPYQGGGYKAIVDAIFLWMCDNPLMHMKVEASS